MNLNGPSLLLSLLLASTSCWAAIGPWSNLKIVNKNISPDGFERPAVLANGVFPAPLIVNVKGGRFRLNVIDKLTDHSMLKSTSIHWHGFFQKDTQWADGPSFVNQCPIASGDSFLYDFSTAGQAGSFWYHSHLQAQYCDGLRGPMVVYDLADPHRRLYDVDNENTVITLSDWYHVVSTLGPKFPTSDSTLINGLGRYAGGPSSPLSIISVRKGRRYRFRVFSLSCDPNYVFSIDRHSLTVIEADGVTSKPFIVDSLTIYAGQRYSVILNANQTVKNYWIRANPNFGPVGFANGIDSAILRYRGAPAIEPTTVQLTSLAPLQESSLIPYKNPGVAGKRYPGGADVNINLAIEFDFNTFGFTVNGLSYKSPTAPVLLQILSGAQTAQDLMPTGSVYELPSNKVIDISMPGGALAGPHPLHLHGHTFDVVRTAGSSTYNYVNPPRRDVVAIGVAGDNVTIRFVTDNPGPWFLHCHIDYHLEAGLAIVFAESIKSIQKGPKPPAAWNKLCPIYNALAEEDL